MLSLPEIGEAAKHLSRKSGKPGVECPVGSVVALIRVHRGLGLPVGFGDEPFCQIPDLVVWGDLDPGGVIVAESVKLDGIPLRPGRDECDGRVVPGEPDRIAVIGQMRNTRERRTRNADRVGGNSAFPEFTSLDDHVRTVRAEIRCVAIHIGVAYRIAEAREAQERSE